MTMRIIFFMGFILLVLLTGSVWAEDPSPYRSTDLPLPRFVSLQSDKINLRTGPALRYPIKWVYQRKYLPVEIVQEFDHWRKIRDIDNEEGWVHKSLLSGKRTALINSDVNVNLYQKYSTDSRIIARVEPGVIAMINECTDGWCKISVSDYSGWIERKFIWGIYDYEIFD